MTTFRVARRRHYKPIDVRTLNDERLSFRARGVLVFLLSKPDDWTFTAESISTCGTEGRDAIRAVLNELSVCGYLVQTKRRDGGRFITDSVLYEHPEDAPPERKTSAGEPEAVDQHRKTRPSTEASLRDAETEDGNRTLAALPRKRPNEEASRELTKEAFGRRAHPPGVKFVGVAHVVEHFLDVGRTPAELSAALLVARAFTANSIEYALSELDKPKRGAQLSEAEIAASWGTG